MAGRCRPNTVLAVACDLQVFFRGVDKPPEQVTVSDVLGFMTAQRTGGPLAAVQPAPDLGTEWPSWARIGGALSRRASSTRTAKAGVMSGRGPVEGRGCRAVVPRPVRISHAFGGQG